MKTSLVPRPPPFLPSVGVHNNTWERKTGKKWGRPGSIHHVSRCEVDVGGRGPYSNIYLLNLTASFLLVKVSSSITLRSGVWKCGRALVDERMVLCVVLAVGPLPPYIHLTSTWCHSRNECSQAFPVLIFADLRFCVLLWMQTEDQNGRGLGPRLWENIDNCLADTTVTVCHN